MPMVRKLIYIALFCSCLLWAGCSSSSQTDSITVKVDLDVEGSDSVEHLLSVSCLVPLQADGMVSSVDKVCMMDSLIYVLDQKQMALFIFNKEGYLRHTLKKLGRASGEYLSLDDFIVDEQGNIYLFDSSTQRITCYDAEGHYHHKIEVCAGTGFIPCGADSLVVYNNILGECNLTIFNKAGNKLKEIPYPKEIPHMLISNGGGVFTSGDRLFFTNPFDYVLYAVDEDKARPVYNFDFGSQNLTEDILKEKDRRQLVRKTIAFEGVRFLKNVAMYRNLLFFATDKDVQCVMDTNTLNVFVFNHMEMPYAVLLGKPVTVCPDGTFLTFVTAANMESLFSMPENYLEKYPFFQVLRDVPHLDSEDYWIVVGQVQ